MAAIKKIRKHIEISEEAFEKKITYNYIHDTLINREIFKVMVISNDKETVTELNYYKSNNDDIYVTSPIKYKNALNLINGDQLTYERSEPSKSLQHSS